MKPGVEDVEEPFFQWARDHADVETGLLLRRVSMKWCREMGRLRSKHRHNSEWHDGCSKATTEICNRIGREVKCIINTWLLFREELWSVDPYNGKMPEPTDSCACIRCKKVRELLAQMDILKKERNSILDDQGERGTIYKYCTCACRTTCCDDNGQHQCIYKEHCIKQFSLRRCRCSTFRTEPSTQKCIHGSYCTIVFVEQEECCGGGIMTDFEEGEEEDDDSEGGEEEEDDSNYSDAEANDAEGDEGSNAE